MSKVLFLVNHDVVIYNFRLELVERLIAEGYDVHVSSPYGERIDDLTKLGVVFHETPINRHGINPVEDLKLLLNYFRLIRKIKPNIILGYTIKPNIYGAIAARKSKVPFIANITGLGTATERKGIKQFLIIEMYRYAFANINKVFFQNKSNMDFFKSKQIAPSKHQLLPGSGVNLQRYPYQEYPQNTKIKFAFISRIMKEKGIEQYLEAAKIISKKYRNVEFHVCGFCEPEYNGKLKQYAEAGIVIYHGMIRDIASFMSKMNCIIHPTYYPEGISNVLLEACATGRPIITTNQPGCREVVDENINGYLVSTKSVSEIVSSIEKFLKLSHADQQKMGKAARMKVETTFNREIVVNEYMKEINSKKKKVLHLLTSTSYSGAENIACTIIQKTKDQYESVYCSPYGKIENDVRSRGVNYLKINKMNLWNVKRAVKTFNPDIIHAHGTNASFHASFFSKKIPVISHIHNNHQNFRKITPVSLLYNARSHSFNKIIWIAESAYDEYVFRKRISNKSIILHNVIDYSEVINKSRERYGGNKYDIVFLGRLTDQKDPIRFIDIAQDIIKIKPKTKIALIGNGDLYDTIKKEIASRQLSNNIDMLGFQENPFPFLKNAKMMIMTSKYEGIPMGALEAQAIGLPIISTPVDGLRNIIINNKNGYLLESNKEICTKALELLNDNEKINKISTTCSQLSKKRNDINKYIQSIESIYEEC